MVQVRETHHINFVIKDLEAARRFYGDVLSLPSLPRPELNNAGLWFLMGDKQLHLSVYEDEPSASSRRHVAILVEDFDETVRTLREHGVPIVNNTPAERSDGGRYLFCEDPHGNRLEIMDRPPVIV